MAVFQKMDPDRMQCGVTKVLITRPQLAAVSKFYKSRPAKTDDDLHKTRQARSATPPESRRSPRGLDRPRPSRDKSRHNPANLRPV